MSDRKKDDEPTIIPESDLDDASAGLSAANIVAGGVKSADGSVRTSDKGLTYIDPYTPDSISLNFEKSTKG